MTVFINMGMRPGYGVLQRKELVWETRKLVVLLKSGVEDKSPRLSLPLHLYLREDEIALNYI